MTPKSVARLAAEENVLGDGHELDEIEFLINDADAGRHRLAGGETGVAPTLEDDLAAVGLIGPGQDFDQRRLAGPILAEQRVNLPSAARKRDVAQRLDAAERLRDIQHFENRGVGHGLSVNSEGGENICYFRNVCYGYEVRQSRDPHAQPFRAAADSACAFPGVETPRFGSLAEGASRGPGRRAGRKIHRKGLKSLV